ncbi:LysM peptidoglycan-binding domain-containing protein, partial [Maricaulis sp. D1M11]|uniref:LysM peptidoglycan-binding domain-containing protein n=1 Tax=Maricaulis sp. D1M11 TaxID=3076117 RepID=UPI0039B3987C
ATNYRNNNKNSNDQHYARLTTTNSYNWNDGLTLRRAETRKDGVSHSTYSFYQYNTVGGSLWLDRVFVNNGPGQADREVDYTWDLTGQTILREEDHEGSYQAPHEAWYRFAGKEMGYTGNNGSQEMDYEASILDRSAERGENGPFRHGLGTGVAHTDFDQGLTPINSYSQGSSGGAYTVRAGDTLASIAANLWGDSSLWYRIAEANGLQGQSALIEGQSLTLPTGVIRNTYNASTFTPYDPNATIGDTSPLAPVPKA